MDRSAYSPYSMTPIGLQPLRSTTKPGSAAPLKPASISAVRPTFDTLMDRLGNHGYNREETVILLELCKEAAGLIGNIDLPGGACVLMDMQAHDLFAAVMPGQALPEAGSDHALLNRYFELPDDCTYLHGRDAEHCLLRIVRLSR